VAEPLGERAVRRQFPPAWEREALVNEAVRKLRKEAANLLLVGEPVVGKTTVLAAAAVAAERLQREEAKATGGGTAGASLFWLTSAGRLIAGMKYLGQWEERCEHVIGELAGLGGVLCVERLLDLVRTGGTGPGDSVAAFLMPYLQRGELRVAAECTPAELDACRRLLPGFADLFPVLQVPAFDRSQVLAVLERTAGQHAQNLRFEAGPEVSARVYQLFRRFVPYQVFPGPAVGFLRDLCERHGRTARGLPLTGEEVVGHFVRRTGLPDWLLRDEQPLDPETLLAALRAHVIGQEEAVQAAARLVTTFKAGLNDPGRPLGVLLFCGPTGVGKTELARALARTLFGHGETTGPRTGGEDRLIRLDMSEYAGPDAADRLLGPAQGQPSALVRRVRQQPFCVLFFDEIEKAGPEVFDILLGVCDEGRLTDHFGRTTTFRSCVIVMTSNLGSDRGSLGFGRAGPPPFADAVRAFFRPEFFNRLDAVVSFRPLEPETIRAITRKELGEIGRREGVERGGLRLRWSDRLVEWLARVGFDARYGARPLQRVIERQVVAPLAKYLLERPGLQGVELTLDTDEQANLRIFEGPGGVGA
jgi:ATP-dependent Clp protease ATP-binding subunit ClpC